MKFAAAALLGLASADEQRYLRYLSRYGKSYLTKEEFDFRRSVFEANMALIEEHNADPSATFVMAENHMADWTEYEFKRLLGFRSRKASGAKEVAFGGPNPVPQSVDWRKSNVLTPVKD